MVLKNKDAFFVCTSIVRKMRFVCTSIVRSTYPPCGVFIRKRGPKLSIHPLTEHDKTMASTINKRH